MYSTKNEKLNSIENKKYNLTKEVEEIGKLNFHGNVIPHTWYKNIKTESGAVDFISITILSEIIYWYRPSYVKDESTGSLIQINKKFKSDALQRSKSSFAKQFGISERQVKDSLARLEKLGLIKRDYRTVKISDEISAPNVLFIIIFPKKIEEITFNLSLPYDENMGGVSDVLTPYDVQTSDGVTKICQPLIYNTKITTENTVSDSVEYGLSEFFLKKILDKKPNFKNPNLTSWSLIFHRMLNIDKRSEDEIKKVIQWVVDDDFEFSNVMSPDKLRKRFDELQQKSKRKPVKISNEDIEKNRNMVINIIKSSKSEVRHLEENGSEVSFISLSTVGNAHPVIIKYSDPNFRELIKHNFIKWRFK